MSSKKSVSAPIQSMGELMNALGKVLRDTQRDNAALDDILRHVFARAARDPVIRNAVVLEGPYPLLLEAMPPGGIRAAFWDVMHGLKLWNARAAGDLGIEVTAELVQASPHYKRFRERLAGHGLNVDFVSVDRHLDYSGYFSDLYANLKVTPL